jgi:phenylalanyl-tRNA synthetase beta chain
MKLPLSWLKDYVDIAETPQQVADRLTFAGIEVEGIETLGASCEGLVVAEVREVAKHPNADKLSVCKVFDGANEIQVVCGAPNVKAGGKYPLAPIGAVLPDGMKIKPAKLRGVESHGMLCSARELKLSEDHGGLLDLDPGANTGTALADVLGPPETVFDLEITPNRPDCLSLVGIARELAAIYGQKIRWPDAGPEVRSQKSGAGKTVAVEDAAGCPRYTARILTGVQVGPSPEWIKRRLEHAGIRSINNVVDITNYVMLECGQPLHAFDRSLLHEGRIVVRRARAGEKMATLDGVVRELAPSMLVIADADRPAAIAGVMGGADSEIRDGTTEVLLESAFFDPAGVRATSRKLGLSTESSYRFERGIDIGRVEWASRRAAALLVEHAGATVADEFIDVYPKPAQPAKIACGFDMIRSLIGVDATNQDIVDVFRALELEVEHTHEKGCLVDIPTFRIDLHTEVDLAEEFARIYGLDRIPTPAPRALVDAGDDAPSRALAALRERLVSLGLNEILNYSLVSKELLDLFDASNAADRIVLPNPISADQTTLRPSLVPQMVETLGRNRARQAESAALFEIGRVFHAGEPNEERQVCIGLMGPVGRDDLHVRQPVGPDDMFLAAKGIWERLAQQAGLGRWSIAPANRPWAEAGQCVEISAGGKAIGELGVAKAAIRKEWRLTDPVAVLSVQAEPLLAGMFRPRTFSAIPAFPSVVRDIAMLVGESVRHEDIVAVIRKAAPPELEQVRIFDIFSGGSIGPGRKSLAYSLTFRSGARTLTDEETNGYHSSIKDALRKSLEVEIREG